MKYYAVVNKNRELQYVTDVKKDNCIELPNKKIACQLTAHRIHSKENVCVFHLIKERFVKTARPTAFSYWDKIKWVTNFVEERKIKMWELGIIYSAQLNKRNPFREQAKEAFQITQQKINKITQPTTFRDFQTEEVFYKNMYHAMKILIQKRKVLNNGTE